jgi:hypothetical protein
MMASPEITPFLNAALAAFPAPCQSLAEDAANALMPFVDPSYRQSALQAVVRGRIVRIPARIHFINLDADKLQIDNNQLSIVQCLCTRSTDGYLRQSALRCLLNVAEPWAIPFVVLLSGEYVVEIIEDIVIALSTLDRDAYLNFVRENRPLMHLLKAQATSYWNCYYRRRFPDRSAYPGLMFLQEVERWAC